ncbi:aromatic acid exporter family protein [Bacillus sp. ISL-45]|uniref:aromatic acid exporter family protein n=1 Tax=Bacillus sp. ISL-45 TaxID=2819128 RepID=UPI001BE530A8|nr:aromatic acid exporter family protein [Bacillus sp. ISL-45]MBT2660900.1 aromatic acid exporter family protein [Bacillus sp. ISL-45]
MQCLNSISFLIGEYIVKFRIGYRTLKTALGTAVSIIIAQNLGLENYVSAGILTILCIQVTKKRSLQASWHRFLACIIAMAFSAVFFEGIAYHPIVIGLLLLFFIPTVVMFKAKEGVVTSSVIIMHIYSAEKFTGQLLLNELGIITIGIGVALIMNLYMPSVDNKLEEYQREIEAQFKKIFSEITLYLRKNDSNWDGRELTETATLIEKAKALAIQDVENHFLRDENLYYQYFRIREKQFEIIERVLPSITSIPQHVEQANIVAEFVESLSKGIHPGNTVLIYLEKLMRMKTEFENMELPKTREEFEARAALLHFVNEMEQFLLLKRSFKGLKTSEDKNEAAVTN